MTFLFAFDVPRTVDAEGADVSAYQERLGERLRYIRQQQGLTLQQVEEKSGGRWKAVVVGSYERGDRAVSVAKLADLAAFFGVPIAELLPVGETPSPPGPADAAPAVMVDLTRLSRDGAVESSLRPLVRYVSSVQVQRGDYNGQVLTLRRGDLRSLAIVLGLETEDLVEVLENRGLLMAS